MSKGCRYHRSQRRFSSCAWRTSVENRHKEGAPAPSASSTTDAGRAQSDGGRPLVAFGSSRRPSDELKDAHKDAEEGGVFAWNVTTEDLAEAMNWSAVSDP